MANTPYALPKNLPAFAASTLELETGFPEELVSTPIGNAFARCSVCYGLPRQPCYHESCGHLFCEACLLSIFRTAHYPKAIPCPVCRTPIVNGEIETFEDWSRYEQGQYKNLVVKCPDCEYKGGPYDVDQHQVFNCPEREIRCPNYGCRYRAKYSQMLGHFNECTQLHLYCVNCQLPIAKDKVAEHLKNNECVARLQQALRGTCPPI